MPALRSAFLCSFALLVVACGNSVPSKQSSANPDAGPGGAGSSNATGGAASMGGTTGTGGITDVGDSASNGGTGASSTGGVGGSSGGTSGADAGSGGSAAGGATPDASADGAAGGARPDASVDAATGGASACEHLGVPGACVDPSICAAMPNHLSTTGACTGAENGECCTPYGVALCDPAADPPPDPNAGSTVASPGLGGCPNGMLRVSTFCIDQYEATLVRVDTGVAWNPFENPGAIPMRAVSVAGAVPQGYINGNQAGDACANAGKRLCTDTEWLRACEGSANDTYPYGNIRQPGVCDDHRAEHPAVEYFGTTDSWIYAQGENACLDQLPETIALTGSLAGCVTTEGAFDMMGNMNEWTADPAGTLRGGSYMDTILNGSGCLNTTTAHDTLYWDFLTGFRCCAD